MVTRMGVQGSQGRPLSLDGAVLAKMSTSGTVGRAVFSRSEPKFCIIRLP